jgi:hypothetical protein
VRRWVLIRITAIAALAIVVLGFAAAPASAHTIGGPRPTNFRSRVVAIAPEVPGISARVVDLGAKLELTNTTSTDATVKGYEGEPYLRIGPDGVFENIHSQATYINRTRQGGTVPIGVDTSPTAKPEWRKISSGQTARWHDHRIHWMGGGIPPAVAASPDTFHHLSQQNVVVEHGDQLIRIAVALDWVPGPSGLPWIPVVAVLFVIGLVAALLPNRWRILAVLVGVIMVADIAHAICYEIARPGSSVAKVLQFVGGNFVSIAVWVVAVVTIVMLLRRRSEALYGVVFVGLLVALIGGATDLSALWKSQLPNAGPAWLARVEVVIALGLGAGLAVGALVRMLRSRPRANPDDGDGGQWISLLVSGLSDAELARIVPELDADEVLEVALRELAGRAQPIGESFANGSFGFVVTDETEPLVWSIVRDDAGELHAQRGRVEPMRAEIGASFAVMLQLLAGTVPVDDAIARAAITTAGDPAFVAQLTPYVPERARVTTAAEDPASAS